MLFSFEMSTKKLEMNQAIVVNDGGREIHFLARKGDNQHIFTNVPVTAMPIVSMALPHTLTVLSVGADKYVTPLQERLDANACNENNVRYRIGVQGKPKRAVITFAHYKGFGGWPAPYTVLDATKLALADTLYISVQDPYFTAGSYFISDDYGNDPVPAIVAVISRTLEEYGLSSSDVTILGSSKGANIAGLVSQFFEDNQLILCAYSMDIEYRVRNTPFRHLASALDFLGVSFPDALSVFQKEARRKETHWFYAIRDDLANQGQEYMTADQLTTYPSQASHSNVIVEHWDEIRTLIDRRHPVLDTRVESVR
ncbi:hypothetical protein CIK74_01810 [Glutamicibacter sp. BW77]|nr:hypothetical protein CIK74_01810 [Glutamicibacter sp. BW77]